MTQTCLMDRNDFCLFNSSVLLNTFLQHYENRSTYEIQQQYYCVKKLLSQAEMLALLSRRDGLHFELDGGLSLFFLSKVKASELWVISRAEDHSQVTDYLAIICEIHSGVKSLF